MASKIVSRSKRSKAKESLPTVKEYSWGSMFTGTKEQLIAAGLAEPKHFKFRKGDSHEYRLPLDWDEGYTDACFGPGFGPIPPCWDAEVLEGFGDEDGLYNVCIKFNITQDGAIRERAEMALTSLRAALKTVEDIVPLPPSLQLDVKANREEPEPTFGHRAMGRKALVTIKR